VAERSASSVASYFEGNLALVDEGGVELAPDVVDPDADGEPVGLQVEDVGLPPHLEVADGVPAAALVDDADGQPGVDGGEEGLDVGDVAFAPGAEEPFPGGSGPLRVGHGVADENEFAAGCDVHGREEG